MQERTLRVAILTNIIPVYREGLYDRILNRPELKIDVFCQDYIKNSKIKSIHKKYGSNIHIVKHSSLINGAIVWQWMPIKKLLSSYDVIVADGNPRHISQAIITTIAKLLGMKVVIWSVAHARRNNSITINIRLFWWKMFDNFLMYNPTDISELKQRGFKKNLLSINNGLDQDKIREAALNWDNDSLEQWKKRNNLTNTILLLSSGRLNNNRYSLMLDALPLILKEKPIVKWCIIGDGSDRVILEEEIKNRNLTDHVIFTGAMFDEIELAPWFLSSEIFVYPAPIGLSILHAFGYGLPVVTHDQKNIHGPEYLVFEEGKTGRSYKYGNFRSLANTVIELISNKDEIKRMSEYVKTIPETKFNTSVMAKRFLQMIKSIR